MTEYTITLPPKGKHLKQDAFCASIAKRKVIVAGRRGGKTTGAARIAVEKFLEGRRVLEAAPVADQTTSFWDKVKTYLREPIDAGALYKNETDRVIENPITKARIRCKTAHDADTLRGDYADLLILDEYSYMHPSAWEMVGAPMLLDNNGDAVFIFTPLRRNHAHKIYTRAVGDTSNRYEAWHYTTYDNPYLSTEALTELTEDMPEGSDAYRQEIMAEFLEGTGAVFRNIYDCLYSGIVDKDAHAHHKKILGVDWGKQNDFTALALGCADCKRELAHDRFNKVDYAFQSERLAALCHDWGVSYILAEQNAMGDPIIEQLQRRGLPVVPFMTTPTSKPPLIENCSLAIERAEWQLIDDPLWTAEMEAYERVVSDRTGRSSYSAPEGLHDDTVIARALMVWAAGNASALPAQPITTSKWKEEQSDYSASKWRAY